MEHVESDLLPNYYAVLNVSYHASPQDMPPAFYSLTKDPKTYEGYKHMIYDAYECLSSPVDRNAYDAFYFHAPCWYSKSLWVAYRNERRKLEENMLRQEREIQGQNTEAQIRAKPPTDVHHADNASNAVMGMGMGMGIGMVKGKGKGQSRRRRRGKGKRKEEQTQLVKKLADSRWADPHTCVNGLRGHPQEGWQMKPGQVQCVACDSQPYDSSYRCEKCDAAFCKECYLKTIVHNSNST